MMQRLGQIFATDGKRQRRGLVIHAGHYHRETESTASKNNSKQFSLKLYILFSVSIWHPLTEYASNLQVLYDTIWNVHWQQLAHFPFWQRKTCQLKVFIARMKCRQRVTKIKKINLPSLFWFPHKILLPMRTDWIFIRIWSHALFNSYSTTWLHFHHRIKVTVSKTCGYKNHDILTQKNYIFFLSIY